MSKEFNDQLKLIIKATNKKKIIGQRWDVYFASDKEVSFVHSGPISKAYRRSMTQNRQAYWSIIFLIVPNKDGITVLLEKGAESSLTYLNQETNENKKFKVYYNSIRSSKTVSQKPDNILSMQKDSSIKSYEFIFDAKYKVKLSFRGSLSPSKG